VLFEYEFLLGFAMFELFFLCLSLHFLYFIA
jgi:hypothetical protein